MLISSIDPSKKKKIEFSYGKSNFNNSKSGERKKVCLIKARVSHTQRLIFFLPFETAEKKNTQAIAIF